MGASSGAGRHIPGSAPGGGGGRCDHRRMAAGMLEVRDSLHILETAPALIYEVAQDVPAPC
ncbi:MAG: hypothetical protein M0Z92_10115 [Actinomycetota bacterium]|nr:hypothetical protein [Actinomycetota bacterium]